MIDYGTNKKKICGLTMAGDIYYVATRLVNYKRKVWKIDPLDKNIEYFGFVWCGIEFFNMLYHGFIAE